MRYWWFFVAAATILLASHAHAADPPPKTAAINLTADQIQIVAAALNMAASTCTQDTNGCLVGLNKAPILAKLQSGAAALSPPVAPPK